MCYLIDLSSLVGNFAVDSLLVTYFFTTCVPDYSTPIQSVDATISKANLSAYLRIDIFQFHVLDLPHNYHWHPDDGGKKSEVNILYVIHFPRNIDQTILLDYTDPHNWKK